MASIIDKLASKQLILGQSEAHLSWLRSSIQYEVVMGSVAYGVSTDMSDMDVYGFCIPPKHMIFPHLAGYIPGFGKNPPNFENWQTHHVQDGDKNYDLSMYSIVRFFDLCMQNNPNMVDALFVPQRCILHSTAIAENVRANRRSFLHKGCWHKFKGYAYSQLHKAAIKNPVEGSKRYEEIKRLGYDSKFLYHVVRLMLECEQILTEGDLDLERNSQVLISIRRGDWSFDKCKSFFDEKEKSLEKVYNESKLPYGPDEQLIKKILLECLEHHYGSLQEAVSQDKSANILQDMENVLSKYRR